MRLRFLVLFLLALPGLGLGQGWSLRICSERLLGFAAASEGCCSTARADVGCCAQDDAAPRLVAHQDEALPCASCCFYVDTPSEPTAPNPVHQHESLQLARAQDLAAGVHAFAALPLALGARAPRSDAAPGEPGRAKPLPLRI